MNNTYTYSQITLKRSGYRPLRFNGKQIASVSTQFVSGKENNRWHEMNLYERLTNGYVLEIEYCTRWKGELNHSCVEQFNTIEETSEFLRSYDPCGYLQGFPPGKQFEEKQVRLEKDLRRRYEYAVSELLDSLPERI